MDLFHYICTSTNGNHDGPALLDRFGKNGMDLVL